MSVCELRSVKSESRTKSSFVRDDIRQIAQSSTGRVMTAGGGHGENATYGLVEEEVVTSGTGDRLVRGVQA